MSAAVRSWNGLPQAAHAQQLALHARDAVLPSVAGSLLAHGNGRSYGDVCLNDGASLLMTRGLDRFISFDRASGVLRCEVGVLLGEILTLALPQGWFLPVTPGTRHVTVGGAIANDVHGKNHHVAGSFGHHVRAFELLRSGMPNISAAGSSCCARTAAACCAGRSGSRSGLPPPWAGWA